MVEYDIFSFVSIMNSITYMDMTI